MNVEFPDTALPARVRLDSPLSDDDLFDFCRQNEPLRVERDANGDLLLMTPSGMDGDASNTDLTIELGNWARQDARGRSLGNNAGFTLPDGSMRSPDAAWTSWPRWNAVPPKERKKFGRLVPEFIVELRSESDRLKPLREKMQMWIDNGVELAWLIDPQRRVVEIYRAGEAPEVHENPTSVQGTGCISGFCLIMDRVWGS
jgi:Uma2 family endonuclease